jgi:hypothetical protein
MVHAHGARREYFCRMLKKLVQQGRRESGDRSVPLRYVAGRRTTENDAGGLFEHPAQGFCLKRNELYSPAMAIVTSSIVSSSRLTMASGVGGLKMKCRPRNSGACDGGVSQGGKRSARDSSATMMYRISMLSCPGPDVLGGGGGGGGEPSTWSA